MKDKFGVVIRPVVTEKSHRLMENAGGRRLKGKAPSRLKSTKKGPRANCTRGPVR